MTVRVGRAFWAVVLVASIVVFGIGWRVRTNDQSQARKLSRADHAQSARLAKAECRNTRGILRRQLAGSRTARSTDRFFATKSNSPVFRSHFGSLIPAQTARIAAIELSLVELGTCK